MSYHLKFKKIPKDTNIPKMFDAYMCNGFCLPSFAVKFLRKEAATYEARPDDIYIVSYPKTGTSWAQEILYLIHCYLDFEYAKTKSPSERFHYLEHVTADYNYVKNMPSPRLFKSHLPYSILPPDIHKKQCKIIYVTRNPRDVAVSYYHFACMLAETRYKGTFDQFFESFILGRATYSPFLSHNFEFWKHKNDKNILFLFYEDMQKDIVQNVRKIAEFLERTLTRAEINSVIEHCSFQSMTKNRTVGSSDESTVDGKEDKVGDWKNYFTAEQISRLDFKVKEVLGNSGLEYTYEI